MTNPLVVFDLGNVLIRIADDWAHACKIANVEHGLSWPLDETKRAQLHAIVVENEIGRMDHDEFCTRAGMLFNLEPKHVSAIADAYLISPFPGVGELLDDLAARSIETACLSNTNVSHWNLMRAETGHAALPLDRLTYRFASQEVGARKPDEAIYKHLERVTKRQPEQIIFFDDKLDNIETAVRLGWNATKIDLADPNPVVTMRVRLEQLRLL